MIDNSMVFAEHYRPKKIEECILPSATKNMIKDAIANGNVPHLIFAGSAGTGKTTTAYAIANELDADVLYMNCSLNTGIDDIRSSVVSYSSAVSLSGGSKFVLLDELEGMSNNAQNSLKGVIESFPNVRFIGTTNHIGKVIEPIQSRCVVINFEAPLEEKPAMLGSMLKRVIGILKERGIEFDTKAVAEIVKRNFPDFRRTLNDVQRYSVSGKIDASSLLPETNASFDSLYKTLREKDFTGMRKWVAENVSMDPSVLFIEVYNNADKHLTPASMPNLIILLADYQFKSSQVADQSINNAAFLTEVMASCTFQGK